MKKFLSKIVDQTHQLRWRLTLNYTGVTVGVLLVLLLIVSSFIFGYAVVPEFFLSPDAWVRLANASAVPTVRTIIKQSPELVSLWTSSLNNTLTDQVILRVGDVELRLRTVAQMDILIIDANGSLLGISDPSLLPSAVIGDLLDTSLLPGLEPVVNAALVGEEDLGKLIYAQELDHSYLVALPILDDSRDKKILGAIIAYVASIPAKSDALVHTLQIAGQSLLFFLFSAGVLGIFFGFLIAKGMTERIDKLSNVTSAWSKGDFSKSIFDPTGDEISKLGEQLNSMAAQLEDLLQKREEIAISEERNRLARDLHDSAKQEAHAASFHLGAAQALFHRNPKSAKDHLTKAENLVDSVREELAGLIHQLRPQSFDGTNFDETLNEYASEWALQTGIKATMMVEGSINLSMENRRVIYRIVQEALANVARHSSAGKVEIAMDINENQGELCISDNGVGFDTQQPFDGIGLKSMHERAELLGGTFSISSELGKGTKILVIFPLE
ncbi:MAG: histidine kinase [Chloroflexota bacterium]